MLSYQHVYHAGNHADVLKHITLMSMLKKLTVKSKPMFYLDTHAGSGVYHLNSEQALKNSEANTGIKNLNDSANHLEGLIADYLTVVAPYQQSSQYPGSPMIADELLRDHDTAFACELHPQAFNELQTNSKHSIIKAQNRNGFEALKAMLPPSPNRGMVLIDPPYENAEEYTQVLEQMKVAVKRWPIGSYAIWYPLLSPQRVDYKSGEIVANPKAKLSKLMLASLAELPVKSVLNVYFSPSSPSPKTGMYGSGMCILNPPWQLAEELEELIQQLCSCLSDDANEYCGVSWLKTEAQK